MGAWPGIFPTLLRHLPPPLRPTLVRLFILLLVHGVRQVEINTTTWDDIGGLEEVKRQVQQVQAG